MSYELTMGGLCMGTADAMELLEVEVADAVSQCGIDAEEYERALNRVRWLANRVEPIKPRFFKGKYGKKYDTYSCGSCGHTVSQGICKYCPECGRIIDWRDGGEHETD